MTALFKKDFYVLGRQMRFFYLMIAVFAVIPSFNMSVFAVIYCGLLPYTAMAYDERSKWGELAAMMPYTVGDIVLSKYLLGWLATAAVTLLSIAGNLLFGRFTADGPLPLSAALISCCVSALLMDVALPFMFRFGAEKGRVALILVMVALACGVGGLVREVLTNGGTGIPALLVTGMKLGVPLAAALATAVSLPLSMTMYRKRLRAA